MSSPLKSLIASGTKLWLDSIDPDLIATNRALGATGATSNPIIVADLIRSGRFDQQLRTHLIEEGLTAEETAWRMTDRLVRDAQAAFIDVWEATRGDDGYVSFELDPLLEDPALGPPHDERVQTYVSLGREWSAGHSNRMIKVPATAGGLGAVEELVASGVTVNVTLIFSMRQYRAARDAAWRGAQRRASLEGFKSVYSIFVSRVDVFAEQQLGDLPSAAQGQVGIVQAKRIWADNRAFWADRKTPLAQEIIFASTGTKDPNDPPWKYVAALAGSDIQTNPPATNDATEKSGLEFGRRIDRLPPSDVLDAIDEMVDREQLETVLMDEGVRKFADPHKALLELIEAKRTALA